MPDLIQFECPSCAATLRIPLEMSGRQGPCPLCTHEIVAPNPYTGVGAYEPLADAADAPIIPEHSVSPQAYRPSVELSIDEPALAEATITRLEPPQEIPHAVPDHDANPKPLKSPFSDLAAVRVIDPASHAPKETAHSYRKIEASSLPVAEFNEEPVPIPSPSPSFTPIPPPERHQPSEKPRRPSKAGWFAVCGLIAILCFMGGFLLGNAFKLDPSPPPPVVVAPIKSNPSVADPLPPVVVTPPVISQQTKAEVKPVEPIPPLPSEEPKKIVAEAEATLRAFLEAPDWKTRSSYVLSPDEVRPKMEIYAKNNSDGPTAFESFAVKHSQVDEKSGSTLLVFQVNSTAAPGGIPVAILETSSGWLVDWESFVEFRDDHFKHFTEGPSDLVGDFHLIVSSPPPSPDIPQENENFASYLIAPPLPDRQRTAFIKKSNPAYAALRAATADGHLFTPVLEVSKRSLPDGRGYLEILSIKATDWRPRENKP
jgi:hypothetical protein